MNARPGRWRRRLDPAFLGGAAWATGALALVRWRLRHRSAVEVRAPVAPALGERGGRGVAAALRRREATCLERSLVHQSWLGRLGHHTDVAVGVRPDAGGYAFHAWIPGMDEQEGLYTELSRIPPRAGR